MFSLASSGKLDGSRVYPLPELERALAMLKAKPKGDEELERMRRGKLGEKTPLSRVCGTAAANANKLAHPNRRGTTVTTITPLPNNRG